VARRRNWRSSRRIQNFYPPTSEASLKTPPGFGIIIYGITNDGSGSILVMNVERDDWRIRLMRRQTQ
jgi:hypothetical protein